MGSIPQKRCSTCGEVKPLSEFHRSNYHASGYKSACKVCRNTGVKAQPKTILAPDAPRICRKCGETKDAREFDVDLHISSGRRATCIDCSRATAREWKARNKARIREYEDTNKDRLRQIRYDWVERNRGRHLAMRRARSNSVEGRAYNRNKQAIRRTASRKGDVTPERLQQLLDSHAHCFYCHKPFNGRRKKTIDHVIPVTKGGEHVMSNLVVACQSCNSAKGDRLLLLL